MRQAPSMGHRLCTLLRVVQRVAISVTATPASSASAGQVAT